VGSGNGGGRVSKNASGEGKAGRFGALMRRSPTGGGKPAPSKVPNPQQIIPLEDDNFKDF